MQSSRVVLEKTNALQSSVEQVQSLLWFAQTFRDNSPQIQFTCGDYVEVVSVIACDSRQMLRMTFAQNKTLSLPAFDKT